VPEVPSFRIEAPPGELSPPLASEDAAHDWAALNRRGEAYAVVVGRDDHPVARRRCTARAS